VKTTIHLALVAALSLAATSFAPPAQGADVSCKLKFSLTGWAAFYKRAEGKGTVNCDNGQSMAVKIKARGGGLTFGKSRIDNGTGKFSPVLSIDDVLGAYAQGDASAAAGKAATAQVVTKGTVSLALAGTGEGVTLGVSFGSFTIERAGRRR